MIRLMQKSDLNELRQIHEKYYEKEFVFPEFGKFIAPFTVIENDQIVVAGGVRTIIESVLITNKDFPVRDRRSALYNALAASTHITKSAGHDQLHAFIQDPVWEKQLKRIGFKDCVGKALVIGV